MSGKDSDKKLIKRDKLAMLLFIGVFTLPLLGLLIMDSQVRMANTVTGSAVDALGIENPGLLVAAVVMGLVIAVVIVATAKWVKHSRFVKSMPLSKVNAEIRRIEEHLSEKLKKR